MLLYLHIIRAVELHKRYLARVRLAPKLSQCVLRRPDFWGAGPRSFRDHCSILPRPESKVLCWIGPYLPRQSFTDCSGLLGIQEV